MPKPNSFSKWSFIVFCSIVSLRIFIYIYFCLGYSRFLSSLSFYLSVSFPTTFNSFYQSNLTYKSSGILLRSISERNTSFFPFIFTFPKEISVIGSTKPGNELTEPVFGVNSGLKRSNLLLPIIYSWREFKFEYFLSYKPGTFFSLYLLSTNQYYLSSSVQPTKDQEAAFYTIEFVSILFQPPFFVTDYSFYFFAPFFEDC